MFGFLFNRASASVVAELVKLQAINSELRARLAAERARGDWMLEHVNELRIERGMLYARIGVDVPVPIIERAPEPVKVEGLPGADDNYQPPAGEQLANVGDVLARAREVRDNPRVPLTRAAIPNLGELSFEDMGDDAARALGIERDAVSGEVR